MILKLQKFYKNLCQMYQNSAKIISKVQSDDSVRAMPTMPGAV